LKKRRIEVEPDPAGGFGPQAAFRIVPEEAEKGPVGQGVRDPAEGPDGGELDVLVRGENGQEG
jgi:hypothetical protein